MGKKRYIKPVIREESQILTVRAWVTTTQYQLSQPTTQTNVAVQRAVDLVTQTSQSAQETVTQSTVFLQTAITRFPWISRFLG